MTFNPNYVTNLPWGLHPAGTACRATRLDAWNHTLEFEDGSKIEVRGPYWLKGLEDPNDLYEQRASSFEAALVTLMAQKAMEVYAEEDARVFKAFDAINDEIDREDNLCGKN